MFKSKEKVIIHYFRKDSNYENWALWLWEFPQGNGKEYDFNGSDSYGITATFPLSNWSNSVTFNNLGFIIKSKGSWDKKDGPDRVIKFYKMSKDKKGNYHVYVRQNDNDLYANDKLDKLYVFDYAKFKDFKTAEIKTNELVVGYKIFRNKELLSESKFEKPTDIFSCKFDEEICLDNEYIVEVKLEKNHSLAHKRIRFAELFKTEKFNKMYNYEGELGAIVEGDSTTFKVWSPVSNKILLRVYKNGTPTFYNRKKGSDEIYIEEEMKKGEKGVFSIKIPRNLHGFYYSYVVTNDSYKNREIVDIYAKSTGINGMRGMVVDFSKIESDDLNKIQIHPYKSTQLTVYEVHIADITSSSTWTQIDEERKYEKTFLGACLEGTTYFENGRTIKTGFDHIKELGVNAVQLLPIFDQANDEGKMTFNWGYNPVNYNVLDGGYSTNPYDGETRIKEFKHLVKKYNEAGINIIMDVVFNHVNGAVGSNFDVLMPGYYFRYTKFHQFSNASGCGNETASDMPMYRKFMIDSVVFWAKEYKIAGFRFDLMSIHDLETMNLLSKTLHEYNQNIVIYGEPWAAAKPMLPFEKSAVKANANKFEGYGFFNDTTRDALLRSSKNNSFTGWCMNHTNESKDDQNKIVEGIKGTSNDVFDPNKIVNYASCHDNRTLFDRVIDNGVGNEKEAKSIAMLANSIVLTSNGISFILSGEEFLRTKQGCDNSYNSSYKINELDYSLKLKNLDMFKSYQKLVKFKQNITDLSLDISKNILINIDNTLPNLISYILEDKNSEKKYKVFHVNGYRNGKPIVVNLEGYSLYLDTINCHKELSKSTLLIPYETLIAYK